MSAVHAGNMMPVRLDGALPRQAHTTRPAEWNPPETRYSTTLGKRYNSGRPVGAPPTYMPHQNNSYAPAAPTRGHDSMTANSAQNAYEPPQKRFRPGANEFAPSYYPHERHIEPVQPPPRPTPTPRPTPGGRGDDDETVINNNTTIIEPPKVAPRTEEDSAEQGSKIFASVASGVAGTATVGAMVYKSEKVWNGARAIGRGVSRAGSAIRNKIRGPEEGELPEEEFGEGGDFGGEGADGAVDLEDLGEEGVGDIRDIVPGDELPEMTVDDPALSSAIRDELNAQNAEGAEEGGVEAADEGAGVGGDLGEGDPLGVTSNLEEFGPQAAAEDAADAGLEGVEGGGEVLAEAGADAAVSGADAAVSGGGGFFANLGETFAKFGSRNTIRASESAFRDAAMPGEDLGEPTFDTAAANAADPVEGGIGAGESQTDIMSRIMGGGDEAVRTAEGGAEALEEAAAEGAEESGVQQMGSTVLAVGGDVELSGAGSGLGGAAGAAEIGATAAETDLAVEGAAAAAAAAEAAADAAAAAATTAALVEGVEIAGVVLAGA